MDVRILPAQCIKHLARRASPTAPTSLVLRRTRSIRTYVNASMERITYTGRKAWPRDRAVVIPRIKLAATEAHPHTCGNCLGELQRGQFRTVSQGA